MFKNVQKYKGVVFVDIDVLPPEYRKVVDMECTTKKPH